MATSPSLCRPWWRSCARSYTRGSRPSRTGWRPSWAGAFAIRRRWPPIAGSATRRASGGPTPLLLRYEAGGFNCLHRDLYGELHFPHQAVFLLSRRGRDYGGGEFLLVENRPRQQARAEVIAPEQGEMVIFPVHERPVPGKRGMIRAAMRHGVSTVHRGERFALGIIFHDAK